MLARSDGTLAFRIAAMECARVFDWFEKGVKEVRISHIGTVAALIALLGVFSNGELRAVAFRAHGNAESMKFSQHFELRVRPELGSWAVSERWIGLEAGLHAIGQLFGRQRIERRPVDRDSAVSAFRSFRQPHVRSRSSHLH